MVWSICLVYFLLQQEAQLNTPRSLSFDIAERRLYWVNAESHSIQFYDLNAETVATVHAKVLRPPHSLDPHSVDPHSWDPSVDSHSMDPSVDPLRGHPLWNPIPWTLSLWTPTADPHRGPPPWTPIQWTPA